MQRVYQLKSMVASDLNLTWTLSPHSDELREAMGLREDQLPSYIYQMRVHGYPPGHLFDAKIEGSGISLFDRHGRGKSNKSFMPG